jgi:N6-L-threonylcarbamoyladenine synthase
MLCLGIESTAHTFGAAVVSDKRSVLSNIRDLYTTKKGGIIPAEAAEHHIEICQEVIKKALDSAGKSIKQIDLISFSRSPGIGHTLRIGALAARSLAKSHGKPLVGVNHCIAHLEIGRMLFPECKDPILLYVSGANTQVIAYDAGRYRIFGETLDMGVGNFLDQFARELGLGFPGGPKIAELAEGGGYIELPYVVKGMDISLGGILTNIKQKIGKHEPRDLAYSAQETVFAMLLEVAERALAHCGKDELLLGGGVGCNKRLQEMAGIMCRERGAKVYVPGNEFLVDNAAMIAWLGILQKDKLTALREAGIDPYERTDDVFVYWR